MATVRFFRRVHIAPGVRLNLAKRGASLSFGVRGAHVTIGRHGLRRTYGLPGSGIFYTSSRGWHTGCHSAPQFAPPPLPGAHGIGGSWWKVVLLVLSLAALAVIGQAFGR